MRSKTRTRFVGAATAALVLLTVTHTPRAQTGGRGVFFDVSGTGTISWFALHNTWRKTWHQIVPGHFGGSIHTDLLFYDRQKGDAKFFTTDGKGNIKLLKYHSGWRKTWDMIIPGEFGGTLGTDLLFYDARNRLARFYSISGGNLTLLKQHSGWQDWDVILPMRLGGTSHTDLFFYSRTRGEAKFFRTANGSMTLVKRAQYQRGWDQIVPGNFNGDIYTDLFFYRRVVGDGKFYAVDSSGNIKLLKSYTTFRKTWDQIVPGYFGGNSKTDLLFYDRTAGQARMAIVDNGNLAIQPVKSIGKSWHRIIPGVFNDKNLYDVLCYDFTHRLRIHAVKCQNADGSRAAKITASQVQQWLDKANEVYAPAGIQFDFDPETDFQVISNDVLNRLDTCKHHPNQTSCDASKNLAQGIALMRPCKVTIFFRHGNRSGATGGGFSNPAKNYIAMPGFNNTTTTKHYRDTKNPQHGKSVQNIKLLAHELGHYLGLPHTFKGVDYTGFTDPHLAVVNYMIKNNKRTLNDMDGDRHRVYDTPPDVHRKYYELKGWNPADPFKEIRIQWPLLNIDITFKTDIYNVMNYWGICDDYIRLSPDQQREVREWLHEPHRVKLLDTCSIPGLVKSFGSSCRAGMKHSTSGTPALGRLLIYRVTGAPAGKVSSLAIGSSRTAWGPIKLPLHLSILGMPGCYAYVNHLLVLRGVTDKNGSIAYPFTVPRDTNLIGTRLFTQGFGADPGANAAGITVTNGMETRLGG